MLDASHVVVFYAKMAMDDDAWLEHVVDQKEVDDCFATLEAKAANNKGRRIFADMHHVSLKDNHQ